LLQISFINRYASASFIAVVLRYTYSIGVSVCFKWAGFGIRAAGYSSVELRRAFKIWLRTVEWTGKERTA